MISRVRSWLPVRVLAAYGSSQAANYAAALAFSAMLAMFPLILGTLAIIGYLIRDPGTEARFETLILDVFPAGAQMQMIDALNSVKHAAGWMGLLSLGGILWTASGLFSTMEFAFTQIFGTKQRDLLRQKAMGLLMMIVLVLAIGITVVANTLVAVFPLAWLSGCSWQDSRQVGSLLGVKTVLNELIAYSEMKDRFATNPHFISPRSALIATYALCGFANFASVGIQVGGISTLAPNRRHDLSRIGLLAMVGGAIASFMGACVVGVLM